MRKLARTDGRTQREPSERKGNKGLDRKGMGFRWRWRGVFRYSMF